MESLYSTARHEFPYPVKSGDRRKLTWNRFPVIVRCTSTESLTSLTQNVTAEIELKYVVSQHGWGVRRLKRDDEEEIRRVSLVQAEAFHIPLALFNDFFFLVFQRNYFPGGKKLTNEKNLIQTFKMPLAISLPVSSISHFFPRRCVHANLRYRCFSEARSSTEEPNNRKNQTGVIIIGAGLAGLAAATRLTSERIPFLLLEASDGVGGRVRTDIVDGFFLDRGFQIFITAYPEAKKLLDYEALDLQRFYAGAKVFYDGKFHTVADPLRHLWDSVASLTNPIGSVVDKGLIALTRARVLIKSNEEILTAADEVSTIDLLRKIGFSEAILDRFFRPFFGGIFFDRDLETTSKLFDFVFRCLALGENTLPAMGIGEISNQLAAKFPANSVLLNTRVASIEYPNGSNSEPSSGQPSVRLQDGDVLKAELGVIIAVEQHEADKLLDGIRVPVMTKPVRSTICLYFTAEPNQIPVHEPVLFLNGSSTGIINNMFFATNVARTYAPPGKALVSVSLIGSFEDRSDDDLAAEVIRELSGWFGESSVTSWKHLKTYRIQFAQPNQCPPTDLVKSPRIGSGLYLCGDYMTSATFDGALVSGRRAVEVLLREKGLIE